MIKSVTQIYTSVACNRIPEIVDWNKQDQICFGASNAVVVYDKINEVTKGNDPLTVLSHHRNKVNSVKWLIKKDGSSSELLSCSADKTAAVWSLIKGKWNVTSSLIGHGDGVTCIHGVYTSGDDIVVYTGCIDSNIRIWERKSGVTTFKQLISLHSGLCLTLHAHVLPRVNMPILFCALDDHKIHVFAGDEEYHRLHILVGHGDWVRGLDIMDADDDMLMLASASQDTYIRLWRIQQYKEQQVNGIRVEEKVFQAYGTTWSVKLDAVLAGHEGWVYGVQWYPRQFDGENKPMHRLLSSSLDKTLIIWEPEGDGAWVEKVRVGEVGGNSLGFYGSRFGPGHSILGHGYNGTFHVWSLDKVLNQWQPRVICGGHFNAVEDVRWELSGRYLLSVSLDQTTRVHAPWLKPDGSTEWHEIARPQVHGYDMSSLAVVSPTTFVSAAEEKVIRVFRAPHNFIHNFRNITGAVLVDGELGGPEGASVPSLGLSNKAVFTEQDSATDEDNDGYFVPVELHGPPTEETLMQNTLWPEVQKLYGHGYEVFALDASADGALVASACKATSSEHAAVLLWETTSWQQIQKLISHQLTVTQLAFSPDSQRLLSVSRDRRWTLYQRQRGSNSFSIAAYTDKKNGVHARIIWCCAWSHDSSVFGTGSRDGKVCVWSQIAGMNNSTLNEYGLVGKPLELTNTSVTALAFAPTTLDSCRVLATGFESGTIQIYSFDNEWKLLYEMDNSAAHHLTVRRLTFKPLFAQNEDRDMLLASCGADHFVRIYNIAFL